MLAYCRTHCDTLCRFDFKTYYNFSSNEEGYQNKNDSVVIWNLVAVTKLSYQLLPIFRHPSPPLLSSYRHNSVPPSLGSSEYFIRACSMTPSLTKLRNTVFIKKRNRVLIFFIYAVVWTLKLVKFHLFSINFSQTPFLSIFNIINWRQNILLKILDQDGPLGTRSWLHCFYVYLLNVLKAVSHSSRIRVLYANTYSWNVWERHKLLNAGRNAQWTLGRMFGRMFRPVR